MTHIVVLGSGFAALTAVRCLRKRGVTAEITLISPRDSLHYLPSAIWIPSGLREVEELQIPLAPFLARHKVRFLQTAVTTLDAGARSVTTLDGQVISADHLIIATGARFLRKLPGIEHALIPCEGLAPAQAISERFHALEGGTIAIGMATNPNEPGAIRGGPMFEYLFILDTLLRRQMRRDRFKLMFFSPSDRPGQRLGEKAVDGILAEMKRRGIETHLGHKMVRIEPDKVVTEAGEIPADLILFQPGLTGLSWFEDTDLPLSPGKMILADAFCRVTGKPGVWVAGDAGSYPGPDWLAKQAHQADLQAQAIAANIAAIEKGLEPATPFLPELICIMDSLDSGRLVFRRGKINLVLPALKPLHWLKRLYEGHYLRAFR
ncbi:NAD(P)/FAD-dependent oxidoreductase [Rhodobacter capsulatus]|jgi:sulfide:quinone oxidoreductase|uniref:Pyridine nucleotide-disulfide oxidoreductase family protein n=1 Tax=Rhodobacter capsulatus (strain ATCC BAA-309 / NBRC 16581 / SB1003) TaxID=272942 RepID=D5ANB9_RHOCB|nr:FAD-dependent oxidoreductase [Rhodobacter capsulatus]ADE86409.1 pyridine nucleotide-disulfide oxidoreductase family protein [Rhodobacter capsulatus SB 1003]ETD00659.1 FAD-dependent pyridine nucleotide-disulfide oxidoreductase [Rhodobacter capsulatus DE442]ETD75291.1 FAD-dependent pyridine nucleotide-disulfide oxidoreductase [Rhodobacter capsulatus R121]ETE52722.1 FAD-dependent pyridine nucleotide-disulfide oxidoreductase [Rhodobacter capsulatus Y262]MDS0928218.1 FAD-dependent oxidoreductase